MIEVSINAILGIIPLVGGYRKQTIEIEENFTVLDILNELVRIYGEDFKNELFNEVGEVRAGITMYINGVSILALDGLDEKLKSGDEFLIFPPIGGG